MSLLISNDDDIRFLTVRQPWASLIASGRKTIELRTWTTRYRGPLVILAGQGIDKSVDYPTATDAPRGGLVALVTLEDVRQWSPADAVSACARPEERDRSAYFSWVLSRPTAIRFVPMRGTLGLTRLANVTAHSEIFDVARGRSQC